MVELHATPADGDGFSRRVRGGQRVLGAFSFLPCAGVVEIMGCAGLDFAIIDLEHSPKSWETVEHLMRAAELTRMAPLVRVARIDDKEILAALEIGAAGIVLPFVESADDVRRGAAALRYPPLGRRGVCTQTRAARYGMARASFVEFSRRQQQDLLLVGLIESRRGLDAIDDILAVENGLDVVFIGRSDLAADFGVPGQTGHPRVEAATRAAVDAVLAAGKRVALAAYASAEFEQWADHGVTVFCLPSESGFILDGLRRLHDDVIGSRRAERP